jgi:hypothetical protein
MARDGSDENSGGARCEGPCVPWPAAVEPVGRSPPTAPRGRDIKPLPACAGLAVVGLGGATNWVAFPDPPSHPLRASGDFAVAVGARATEWVGFPDPPSSAPVRRRMRMVRISMVATMSWEVTMTAVGGDLPPPGLIRACATATIVIIASTATPDLGTTPKVDSPIEPGSGRTGKSATRSPFERFPERSKRRKNRQVRHPHRFPRTNLVKEEPLTPSLR